MGRGQTTIYVILGIVLIMVVGVFLFSRSNQVKDTEFTDTQLIEKEISRDIDNCMTSLLDLEMYGPVIKAGGFLQEDLDETNSILIGDTKVSIWNNGKKDVSPGITDIEEIFSKDISRAFINCVDELITDPNVESLNEVDEDWVEVNFFEDHIQVSLDRKMSYIYSNIQMNFEDNKIKSNFNLRKDIELAKRIISDSLKIQPQPYDIMLTCTDYTTNKKTNIYSIDIPPSYGDGLLVISIIDYEPIYENKKEAVRLNYAVQGLNIMGFCAG